MCEGVSAHIIIKITLVTVAPNIFLSGTEGVGELNPFCCHAPYRYMQVLLHLLIHVSLIYTCVHTAHMIITS